MIYALQMLEKNDKGVVNESDEVVSIFEFILKSIYLKFDPIKSEILDFYKKNKIKFSFTFFFLNRTNFV